MTMLMEQLKFAKGIDPVADAFAGSDVRSDVVSLRGYSRGLFVVHVGVGATGTSTITVNSCDAASPGTRTPIAFWSRQVLTGDTESAITRRTSSGFTYTAGSSKLVLVEVDARDLAAGDAFVELELDESVDSPVLAGVLFIGGGSVRYAEDIKATVIA